MNKRIKKKHETKENKNLMENTLTYLRTLGLTPFNIEYPNGYFFSENLYPYEIMHFQLKERPEFLFGIWYKYVKLDNSNKIRKIPTIFGKRICILDKFKPSHAEWSPMYTDFVYNELEFKMSDYWSTLRTLPNFVKAPWNYVLDWEIGRHIST